MNSYCTLLLLLVMSEETKTDNQEWRTRVLSSREAKEARTSLEFQRRKKRQLHEELQSAEMVEAELVKRLKSVEDNLKPSVLRFREKLRDSNGVDLTVVRRALDDLEDPRQMIKFLRKGANMAKMERPKLLGLMRTLHNLRICFQEKDAQDAVDIIQARITSFTFRL